MFKLLRSILISKFKNIYNNTNNQIDMIGPRKLIVVGTDSGNKYKSGSLDHRISSQYPTKDELKILLHPNILSRYNELRGHFGAFVAHRLAWKHAQSGIAIILENDIEPLEPEKIEEIYDKIHHVSILDRNWDILLLGFSCDKNWSNECNITPQIMNKGIAKIDRFSGMWAYCIRDPQKLLELTKENNKYLIEQTLSQCNLRIYGCIPNIVKHPGKYYVYDLKQVGHGEYYSTTNITIQNNNPIKRATRKHT